MITADDKAFAARTAGPASEVAAGSRVTAQCTLHVVADYEWDAFGLPDLRAGWQVRRLKIEHRQVDYAPGGPGYPGKVLRCFEIERSAAVRGAPLVISAPAEPRTDGTFCNAGAASAAGSIH